MKQIALDIGLADGPTFANFWPGPNQAVLDHLRAWGEHGEGGSGQRDALPVPNYLWGASGSCGPRAKPCWRVVRAWAGWTPA
jgi:DnaA family protein